MCYVGLVYPRPHFGLLSRGEAAPIHISMWAPETTAVVPIGLIGVTIVTPSDSQLHVGSGNDRGRSYRPNRSHHRDSQLHVTSFVTINFLKIQFVYSRANGSYFQVGQPYLYMLFMQAVAYFAPSSAIPGQGWRVLGSGSSPVSNVYCRPLANATDHCLALAVAPYLDHLCCSPGSCDSGNLPVPGQVV